MFQPIQIRIAGHYVFCDWYEMTYRPNFVQLQTPNHYAKDALGE